MRDGARADNPIVALELDPAHAAGTPADGAHVGLREPDPLARRRDEQQLEVVPAVEHTHDPIFGCELHRDDPVLAARGLGELCQRAALDTTARGHEHEVRVLVVHPRVEHRDHSLTVAELEQVLCGGQPVLGKLVHGRPVGATPIGEEEHSRER